MENLPKALSEEIAKKHGFKPEKDDPILALLTAMEFFTELQKAEAQEFRDQIADHQQDFLLKWQIQAQELAEKALTASLQAAIKTGDERIEKASHEIEKRLEKANEDLATSLSKIQSENKKEWKKFGLTQADINLIIFLLLFMQIFLFSVLIWKHW